MAEARRLLAAALADAQSELPGPQGPQAELVEHYKQLLERLAVARGGATYFPYLSSGLGNGPLVELADGSIKFDFITGIGVHGLGHSHPQMLDATIDAALEDTIMQGNLQQHPPSLRLCERLLALACKQGAKLAHCLLSTSGAMANENALKIAFHNRHPRRSFVRDRQLLCGSLDRYGTADRSSAISPRHSDCAGSRLLTHGDDGVIVG